MVDDDFCCDWRFKGYSAVDWMTGTVCSGSTLFASILNSSVMLGNHLQQTTFSDAFFSWRFKS